ncbi:MAG: malate synthase A, partial [Pseudomonadota bacterium]
MQKNIQVKAKIATELQTKVLNDSALEFLYNLHKKFDQRRLECLKIRQERQLEIDQQGLNFLSATESIRGGDWHVAAAPKDLQDRRVEITGPVDRKMVINALNSGAKVFMADFEDANSPTWENCLQGQLNLQLAIRRNIDFTAANGKKYQLNDEIATL